MIARLFSLIMKEIITLLRDPKSRLVLVLPPVMQLLLFSYAVTLDVNQASVLIYNQDSGKHAYEVMQRLHGSPTFSSISFVKDHATIQKWMDQQKALVAVVIPQDFSRLIEAGESAQLQLILDGRKSNSAQIVNAYVSNIINDYNEELIPNTAPKIACCCVWESAEIKSPTPTVEKVKTNKTKTVTSIDP